MSELTRTIDGIVIPPFLYGTAWKEDRTRTLTEQALKEGFRGIDTANQRRHYVEAGVGEAIRAAFDAGICSREELLVQTKFTFREGQDHRLPYDPSAPVRTQVEQSFTRSLEHLGIDGIDSYVLHGPSQYEGLGSADRDAWQAMESLHDSGQVRFLGVSNVNLDQLRQFCDLARVPPRFVQNRCYAVHGWDRDVREFCTANSIIYQGFSLLTANRPVLMHPTMARIAERHERGVAAIVFRFALDVGMLPLTGTTNPEHMRMDLDVRNFDLEPAEIEQIERIALP